MAMLRCLLRCCGRQAACTHRRPRPRNPQPTPRSRTLHNAGTWPGPKTPVPGLYACGDSCMPGIGVPAAAASGMIAANTLAPVWSQLKLLDTLGL